MPQPSRTGTPRNPRGEKQASRTAIPRWDLSHLYKGLRSRQLARDKKSLAADIQAFTKQYKGKVATLSAPAFGAAIGEFEELTARLRRIGVYSQLLQMANIDNGKKTAPLDAWVARQEKTLSAFEVDILCVKEGELILRASHPDVARYAPWLAELRTNMRNGPAESEENDGLIATTTRQYYETLHAIRVEMPQGALTLEEARMRITDSPDPEDARAVRAAAGQELKRRKGEMATLFNTIARANIRNRDLTDHETVEQVQHAINRVNAGMFDEMARQVRDTYELSRRYHEFSWRDIPQLPPPEPAPYAAGRAAVLRGAGKFSRPMGATARRLFTERYVDAQIRRNKLASDESQSTVPGTMPYIHVFYDKTLSSALLLGHEVWHALHAEHAMRAQGHLMHDPVATVAEVSSLFGEAMTAAELARKAPPQQRVHIKNELMHNMMHNIYGCMARHDFEVQVHREIEKKGRIGGERISDIWLKHQRATTGRKNYTPDNYNRYDWATHPMFVELSFYNYSYVYGQIGANVLYRKWQSVQDAPAAREDFVNRFTEMQQAGLRMNFREAMAHMGFDSTSKAFCQQGLEVVREGLKDLAREYRISKKQALGI